MLISTYINKNNFAMNNTYYQGKRTNKNRGLSQTTNFIHEYKTPNTNLNIKNAIIEEDSEISEEFELLKELLEKLGVTENYVSNFELTVLEKGFGPPDIYKRKYIETLKKQINDKEKEKE